MWKTRKTVQKHLVNIWVLYFFIVFLVFYQKIHISSINEINIHFFTNSNILQVNSFFEK